MLRDFFVPGFVRTLLAEISEDEELLVNSAKRSYSHANGFEKLVLGWTEKGGPKLRLHIWPDNATRDSTMHIHDHCWDFASIVLKGALVSHDFQAAGDDGTWFHYRCPNNAVKADTELVSSGVRLKKVAIRHFNSGDAYEQNMRLLHWATPALPTQTITLVLQGPHLRDNSNVFTQSRIDADLSTAPRLMSAIQVARCIDTTLRAID